MKPLLHLLDGKSDKPLEKTSDEDLHAWRKTGRLENVSGNRSVFAVKYEALIIVDDVLNYKTSSLLNEFMYDFKKILPEATKYNAEGSFSFFFPLSFLFLLFWLFLQSPPSSQLDHTRGHHIHLALPHGHHSARSSLSSELAALVPYVNNNTPIPVNLVHNYFEFLKHTVEFMDPEKKLVSILMDLARYDDSKLVSLALRVANRHFSQINELFERGTEADILIVPDSIKNFKYVRDCLPVLRRLVLIKLEDEHIHEMSK